MYAPKHFEVTDTAVMHDLIERYPLATWVTQQDGDLVVNHIPFMIDRTRGPLGTLVGHVARANPVWQRPEKSVLVFQGPDAYISPSMYASKREHGKVVPTWDYAVVHAHGCPHVIQDRDALLSIVSRLTDTHEASRSERWHVADAPGEYVTALLGAIVGIEVPIDRLVGKWKVSQNRSAADRQSVAADLRQLGRDDSVAMAALVEKFGPAPPAS